MHLLCTCRSDFWLCAAVANASCTALIAEGALCVGPTTWGWVGTRCTLLGSTRSAFGGQFLGWSHLQAEKGPKHEGNCLRRLWFQAKVCSTVCLQCSAKISVFASIYHIRIVAVVFSVASDRLWTICCHWWEEHSQFLWLLYPQCMFVFGCLW